MTSYPAHYAVKKPEEYGRLQLLMRFAAFVVLGLVGLSLGTLFVAAYVGLPILVAARLRPERSVGLFLLEDGGRIERGLRWMAAIYAWFGLIVDELPVNAPDEIVTLQVERTGAPTRASALLRILTGLPSALVLALLSLPAALVWIWAALDVLLRRRVSDGAWWLLSGMQRWAVRLLAYQASLVDEYPPFTFEDVPPGLPALRG